MKIALGSDHRGFALKNALIKALGKRDIETEDFGAFCTQSCDYPDYAVRVAQSVVDKKADQGILICATGVGMSMAANKIPGIRAALCATTSAAQLVREHNDANILILGGDTISTRKATAILDAWLGASFSNEERHTRRIEKIGAIERNTRDMIALRERDPKICAAIQRETKRQQEHIELIASENLASRAVLDAQGSVLTNKYAEGYPGKRWYNGCGNVDEAERLAIDRAKQLFGAEHANVQPHCGSSANMAVYFAALQPGDTILAMKLAHGGHLTHGHNINFSGRLFNVVSYGVSQQTDLIDYDEVEALAAKNKPRLIVAGASAYSRIIDFARLRQIADSAGAWLMVDMAHVAGLIAAGCHPNPVPYCEFVTATTHKTLCGPRGGMILCRQQFAEEIDRQVFPGIQGGPLMHVIAAKAVCFHQALQPQFKEYQKQVVVNSKALAGRLAEHGFRIVSGGTDTHLALVDLSAFNITGKDAAAALEKTGITVNKNAIPFDTRSPFLTSGIRVGTPTVTARGMKEPQMTLIANLISRVLTHMGDDREMEAVRCEVSTLVEKYPVTAVS